LAIGSYSAGAENVLHLDDAQQEILVERAIFERKIGGTPIPIHQTLVDTKTCVALLMRLIIQLLFT
jgi:hypothetical protein